MVYMPISEYNKLLEDSEKLKSLEGNPTLETVFECEDAIACLRKSKDDGLIREYKLQRELEKCRQDLAETQFKLDFTIQKLSCFDKYFNKNL